MESFEQSSIIETSSILLVQFGARIDPGNVTFYDFELVTSLSIVDASRAKNKFVRFSRKFRCLFFGQFSFRNIFQIRLSYDNEMGKLCKYSFSFKLVRII